MMHLQITDFLGRYDTFAAENNVTYTQPHTIIDAIKSPSTNFEWKTFTGSDIDFFDESFDEINSKLLYLSFDFHEFEIVGE